MNDIPLFYQLYKPTDIVKINLEGSYYLGSEFKDIYGVIIRHNPDYSERIKCIESGCDNPNNCSCWQFFKIRLDNGSIIDDLNEREFDLIDIINT